MLWAFIVVSAITTFLLLWCPHDPKTYSRLYLYSTPVMMLVEGFAIVGVFWTLAEHYPRFRGPGRPC